MIKGGWGGDSPHPCTLPAFAPSAVPSFFWHSSPEMSTCLFDHNEVSPSPWRNLAAAPTAVTHTAQSSFSGLLAVLGDGLAPAATMVMVTPLGATAPNRPPRANICLKQHSRSPWMSPLSCPKTSQDTSAPKLQRSQQQPSAKQWLFTSGENLAVEIGFFFFFPDVILHLNKAYFGGVAQMPPQCPPIPLDLGQEAGSAPHLPQATTSRVEKTPLPQAPRVY